MKTPVFFAQAMAGLALLGSISLTNVGCGSARRGEPLKGSVAITDDRVAQGRQIFMMRCDRCHPGGEAGLGPALNDKLLPGFLIHTQVRVGLGAMPSFPQESLSDRDISAIIAYLKAIRRADAKPM